MGSYRKVFNWVVSQKEQEYLAAGKSRGYFQGRKDWIALLREEFPWLASIPAHTIYGAMMDADKAYKVVVGKRAKGTASELPRCRKRTQRSFFILGDAINSKGIYPRLLGSLRAKEPLPNKPSDSRILTEAGKWYLCVPEKRNVALPDNQRGVISLDPGLRTFLTGFSNREIVKVADGSFGRIVRLAHYLDDLLSRASKAPSRRKQKMYLAAARMRVRIRNLVDDLHYQAIGWLLRNYTTIILPEGNFTNACKRAKRKISRKSVRALLGLAFGRFRERLISKAQELGRNVIVVNEAYTSKTAAWTGEIVQTIGAKKVIKSDGLSFDRDVNGALGIFLKALVDHPVSVSRGCNC